MIRTWHIMKEITGKYKVNSIRFSKSINVNGKHIDMNSQIADEFNNYFTYVGPSLARKIPNISTTFQGFLLLVKKNMEYRDLTFRKRI